MRAFSTNTGLFCAVWLFVNMAQCFAAEPPAQALAAGYRQNTFESRPANDFDANDTRSSKFKWYIRDFQGRHQIKPEQVIRAEDGAFVVNADVGTEIATATGLKTNKNRKVADGLPWVGKAFGGGGYFEAEMRFDPALTLSPHSSGWPAFWSMSIEHLAAMPEEMWGGYESGIAQFMEVDFFEYIPWKALLKGGYSGNLHEWYGEYKKSCPNRAYCNITLPTLDTVMPLPKDVDLRSYHRYGFLWIPATPSSKGSAQFYFDNKQVGKKVTWDYYQGQKPTGKRMPWTFAVLDKQHLVLMFGTAKNQPLYVRTVTVWQKSDQENLMQTIE